MSDEEINRDSIVFDSSDEDGEDYSVLGAEFREIGLFLSDWTTQTISWQLSRENILLHPRFQRRDAWTRAKKSAFIESLILGIPVPQIVLAEEKNNRGRYLVIDGKQRLLTIGQFYGLFEGKNCSFALRGLKVLPHLNGLTYSNLNTLFQDENTSRLLDNQTIRCVVINHYSREELLHLMFHRLNTGSVSLSPQELRLALHPGWFSTYIDDKATESKSIQILLNITEPDFRMRDVELLTRYIAFKNFIDIYNGNMQWFLDETYRRFNSNEGLEGLIARQLYEFELACDLAVSIFGSANIARKPTPDSRGRFNRAIFDILVYYFSEPQIRKKAQDKKHEINEAFIRLWHEDNEFVESVERTTKSLKSVSKRFECWGSTLASILDESILVPTLDGNRIKLIVK